VWPPRHFTSHPPDTRIRRDQAHRRMEPLNHDVPCYSAPGVEVKADGADVGTSLTRERKGVHLIYARRPERLAGGFLFSLSAVARSSRRSSAKNLSPSTTSPRAICLAALS